MEAALAGCWTSTQWTHWTRVLPVGILNTEDGEIMTMLLSWSWLVASMLVAAAPETQTDEDVNIMVLEFRGTAEPKVLQAGTNAATAGISEATEGYQVRVVQGEKLQELVIAMGLDEKGMDERSCTTLACQLKTIQDMGFFRYVVVGEIMDVQGSLYATVKVLDAKQKMEVLQDGEARGNPGSMATLVRTLAKGLAARAFPLTTFPRVAVQKPPQGTLFIMSTRLDDAKQFTTWWGPEQLALWDLAVQQCKGGRPFTSTGQGPTVSTQTSTGWLSTTEALGLVKAARAVDLVMLRVVSTAKSKENLYALEFRARRLDVQRKLFGEELVTHLDAACDPRELKEPNCKQRYVAQIKKVVN